MDESDARSYEERMTEFYDAVEALMSLWRNQTGNLPSSDVCVELERLKDILGARDFSGVANGDALDKLLKRVQTSNVVKSSVVMEVLWTVADGYIAPTLTDFETSLGKEPTMSTQTLTPPPNTATVPAADERCDRCNAAGKLRVKLAGGGELVFCGHHANKYSEDLVKIAVEVATDPEFKWEGHRSNS